MSLLICGMKLPSGCDDCWALDEYGDYPRCRITEKQCGYNFQTRQKRMDNCPLVPVLPHGRCIDADKLADIFRGVIAIYNSRLFSLQGMARRNELQFALAEVMKAPTIIPADECGPSYEKKISMTEYEQALHDLYVALRFSEWKDNKPYLYEINGTAKVIADAVCALVEKRSKRN